MDNFNETLQQTEIADYSAYLQLKQLKFTNMHIAISLGYSIDKFGQLISSYSFINELGYYLQEQEGTCNFNGEIYVSKKAQNILNKEETLEIDEFTKELVEQHNGIFYIQKFKHIRLDRNLFLVDQLNRRHSMIMLESEFQQRLQ